MNTLNENIRSVILGICLAIATFNFYFFCLPSIFENFNFKTIAFYALHLSLLIGIILIRVINNPNRILPQLLFLFTYTFLSGIIYVRINDDSEGFIPLTEYLFTGIFHNFILLVGIVLIGVLNFNLLHEQYHDYKNKK